MPAQFPSQRYRQLGASPNEIAEFEEVFDALSPEQQEAEEQRLASVDNDTIRGYIADSRKRAGTPEDALGETAEGEGVPVDELADDGVKGARSSKSGK